MIAILIILIGLIYIFNNKNIEPYDDRYTDSTMEKCAKFCKTREGCYAFAFDKNKKICYPSQRILVDRPFYGLYKDLYNPEFAVCNKVKPIEEPSNKIPFTDRKSNAMYECAEKAGLQPHLYFHNQDKLILLDEGQNFDFISEVDNYEVLNYRWTKNRYNYDHIDLLSKDRDDQINSVHINKDLKTKVNSPLSLNNLANIGLMTLFPKKKLVKPKKFKTFKMYDDFNNAEYLKNHKCVKGISKQRCLNYCMENINCEGVEWNPLFYDQHNVCCPYRKIGQFVPRKDKHKLGQFYLKAHHDKLDTQNTYIY